MVDQHSPRSPALLEVKWVQAIIWEVLETVPQDWTSYSLFVRGRNGPTYEFIRSDYGYFWMLEK